MPGWHRIWLHLDDPLISLSGAIINNDEHYDMETGNKLEDLSPNKLELSGIDDDSTYIDVLVVRTSGNRK